MTYLDTDDLAAVRWHDLAAAIATIPGSAEHLLHRHVRTATGRCAACVEGGTGVPVTPWPCSLHRLATEALDLRDGLAEVVVPPAPRRRVNRPGRGPRR